MDSGSWGEAERRRVQRRLEEDVLGEVRLMRNGVEWVVRALRGGVIENEAPPAVWAELEDFVRSRFRAVHEALLAEQADWPEVTDCDRLDAAEASLARAGIALWQVSPCCDSCTVSELPEWIDERGWGASGPRGPARGYAFYIEQNLALELSGTTELNLSLGYGWLLADQRTSEAEYREQALAIGREVVEHLRAAGLQPAWNEDLGRKIGVRVDWRRRAPLRSNGGP